MNKIFIDRALIEQAIYAMDDPDEKQQAAISALFTALAEPVVKENLTTDQTALELCNVCGWRAVIPTEGCLNCEREKQLMKKPPAEQAVEPPVMPQLGAMERKMAELKDLHDELTRLSTPLSDEQIAHAWSVGEHNASASTKRRITRALENLHGIGGGES